MTSKSERFVGIYEMTVRPIRVADSTAEISIAALQHLRHAVRSERDAGTPIQQELSEGRLRIIFDDFRIYQRRGVAAMLFTVADADAADAVYRHLKTGQERRFRKGPDEGGAVSAHLVMKLAPQPDARRYRVALEDVEGASRSRILPFLESAIRTYCGLVTTDTGEGPRTGEAVLEMDSVHKDTIQDAAGRPVAVDLVSLRSRRSLDHSSPEGYTETRRSIAFRIDSEGDGIAALLRLRRKQKTTYQDYPLMRIRWKRPDSRMQTLSLEGMAEDLLQRAFTRMDLISGITPDLPASMVDIRDDFVSQIARIL